MSVAAVLEQPAYMLFYNRQDVKGERPLPAVGEGDALAAFGNAGTSMLQVLWILLKG